MNWLKESLKKISPIYILVMVGLIIGLCVSVQRAQTAEYWSVFNAKRATGLQTEIDRYRLENAPREFRTLEEFQTWLDLRQFETNIPADQTRAQKIQYQALRDGKILNIQIVINSVTKTVEWWPTARIGQEFYVIEPLVNTITKYYPATWWRY